MPTASKWLGMEIYMGVFEHCIGCSGCRKFWMQDALGDVGTSNRGFYHGSLTRDDSISVSRANQHPDPILAAFLPSL